MRGSPALTHHPLKPSRPQVPSTPQSLAPLSGPQRGEVPASQGGREAEASGDQGRRKKRKEGEKWGCREQTEEKEVGRLAVEKEVAGRGGRSLVTKPVPLQSPGMSTFSKGGIQKGPVHPPLKEAGRLPAPLEPPAPCSPLRLLPLPQAWGSQEQGEGRRAE